MKFIAYYLPQFHEIPENNLWWGEGFTEWSNVRKMKPLFKGHYQPHEPLDDNYYNLTDRATVEWQTKLMKKYNVYGFAYYHYWFNGKLLLEKPIENLLNWKDIDQNFFFFWANHSWIKSTDGNKKVLIKQTYSGKDDWKNHFNYFLPYFKDKRYIKISGKPVIAIYKPEDIPDLNGMINYWNVLACKNGFNGVYIIESINGYDQRNFESNADADMLRQPNLAMWNLSKWYNRFLKRPRLQKMVSKYYPFKIDYGKVIDNVIDSSQKYKSNKKIYYSIFSGWDNTCRHGRRGYINTNINAEDFKRGIDGIRNLISEDDFVFINAWNEWAEGMHLEPDKKNKFSFLEVLKNEK